MSKPNPLSLYKLLPKTNCRECGKPACMAFAHSLISGEAEPNACPHLSEETIAQIAAMLPKDGPPQEGYKKTIEDLREAVRNVDLASRADGLGGRYEKGRLILRCLGKDFVVLDSGMLESMCHVNAWVELMLLNYCKMGGSGALSGRWVSYGELEAAAPTAPYFERRTVEPLRALADGHPEVFFDLMEIFGGDDVEGFDAGRAVVINPLPKVPFLLLYTPPEDEFPSTFKVLLDSSVTTYIPKEAITYIGRGIVEMVKKILSKHQKVTEEILFM